MKHCFILGQTGTGKSTMLESMILQDIRAGHGLAVIDPHGDLVEPILGKIPKERSRDVIYFNKRFMMSKISCLVSWGCTVSPAGVAGEIPTDTKP